MSSESLPPVVRAPLHTTRTGTLPPVPSPLVVPPLIPDLASLEYSALQQEKRDRMNARLSIWSLVFTLVSGFGLASLQGGTVGDLVGLYPPLSACLARYAGHSEAVLDQIKRYLFDLEEAQGYGGYEHYNAEHPLRFAASGGHKYALRLVLLVTEAGATLAFSVRLVAQGWYGLAALAVLLESGALLATWRFLREGHAARSRRWRRQLAAAGRRARRAIRLSRTPRTQEETR